MDRNEVNEMLLEYAKMDYSELVDIAKDSIDALYPIFEELFAPDEDDAQDAEATLSPEEAILAFIFLAHSMDNEIGKVEVDFLHDIVADTSLDEYLQKELDIDWDDTEEYLIEDFQDIADTFREGTDLLESLDEIFDEVDLDIFQIPMIRLLVAICAVDKNISIDEIRFVQKLID